MGELEVKLAGKSLADYTNTQLRLALGAVLYTNTADMWKRYLNQLGYSGDVSQMLQKYYVDNNVPSQFRNYINAGASIFNPQHLFLSSEQGYVYDLNDSFAEKTAYRRNLLTWSEQFDNAYWLKNNASVTANAVESPFGGTTADLLIPSASSGALKGVRDLVLRAVTTTCSVYVKPAGYDFFSVTADNTVGRATINLLDGTSTVYGGSVTLTRTAVGGGWYRVIFNVLSGSGYTIYFGPNSAQRDPVAAWTSDGVSGAYIWGAQLEVGSTATEYQRVTDWNTELLAAFPQTALYLDSAGTTAATVNGLVGLVLDKSKGLALGEEKIVNSDFSQGSTGWGVAGTDGTHVLTFSNGTVRYQSDTTTPILQLSQVLPSPSASATYVAEISISNYVSGSLKFDSDDGDRVIPASVGIHRLYFRRASGGFTIYRNSANVDITLDYVSVREIKGNHAYQATTGNKPVLRGTPVGGNLVTNGDFASGTGWIPNTWVISGGAATATNVSDSLAQNYTFTAGNVYRVTFTITAFSGTGGVRPRFFGGTTVTGSTRSATGTYVEYMTAVTGNNQFALASTTTTATITVDNVEIVDVSAGSVQAPYALQFDGVDDFLQTASVDFATVTSDGLARRNLLTFPSAFDNAIWSKTGATITANATTAPDGLLTADTLVEDTSTGQHRVIQAATVVASTTYAASFYVKANGRTRFEIFDNASASNTSAIFDLSSGTLVSKGAAAITADIVSVGSGWFRVVITTTPAVTTYSHTIRLISSGTTTSYTGDGTSGIFIWGAQLEAGSTASTFQNIGTDKMTVCHGVRKLSDAALGVVVELSTSVFANPGAFWIAAPDSAANNLQFRAGGTTTANLVRTGLVAPTTLVVLGRTDISGDSLILRVNQSETTSLADQGTGNLGNYPLYFGRRAGTSLPYNGLMFSAICVGKAVSATELANIERWTNQRTGAY